MLEPREQSRREANPIDREHRPRIGHDRRRRLRHITPMRWPIGGLQRASGHLPHGLGHGLDRLGRATTERRQERPLVVVWPERRRIQKDGCASAPAGPLER